MESPPLLLKPEDHEILQLYLAVSPNASVLRKPELTGRLEKWSIYLSSYNIEYKPRVAIKSQALADFVPDFSPELEASTNIVAGLGVVLKSPHVGSEICQGWLLLLVQHGYYF
ncbi:hypothetical protein L6452_07121 [Arctium lappa]|uniref:Uncharacterized protein n=1 Tax=Arctium lappa TaxID=4217 RepID=A0ACB9EKY6_ARCLA|nr:hypothetical protein L6452_07121 [Arctium lappa]